MDHGIKWLPEMISVNGEWETVKKSLYSIFINDFKIAPPSYNNMRVWHDRKIESGDKYENSFWHLITKYDNRSGERLFDPRRSERLPWCKPAINNSNDPVVKSWISNERGRSKAYIWLEAWDYVVILEIKKMRIGEVAFLITAFYVEGDSTRRKLKKRYKNRLN